MALPHPNGRFLQKESEMPIDFIQDEFRDSTLFYTVRERFRRGSHQVLLVEYENVEVDYPCGAVGLVCECDNVDGVNSEDCPHLKDVRRYLLRRAKRRNRARWKGMTLKEAVLDIHGRVKAREYLAQVSGGAIYVQEVARLLDRGNKEVLAACHELYGEEKLELHGMILADHEPCFRFPHPLGNLMAYLTEVPLGWPNGEAGSFRLWDVERRFQEQAGVESGRAAFGKHWPNMDVGLARELAVDP
ncbi:hypothetical protein ACFL26_02405, partial [Patescibacteria group bacterium]